MDETAKLKEKKINWQSKNDDEIIKLTRLYPTI